MLNLFTASRVCVNTTIIITPCKYLDWDYKSPLGWGQEI